MNSSAYRFTLDLHSTQSQVSLPVTLGDTARVFYISFSDGGRPYTVADGCLAMISIKRPTGTFLEEFCAIESNTTVKYDFEQNGNTAVVEGVHDCSITLYNEEGRELASPSFTMMVSEKVVNHDDINLSDEQLTRIDAIMQAEVARQNAEASRANAESARVAAEEERVDAEIARAAIFKEQMDVTIPLVTSITLLASEWIGDEDPYSQVVDVAGVDKWSKVDLLPSVEQLAIFHDKDIAFVTENEDGVVTVYAIGDKPTQDYTMDVVITKVTIPEGTI